MNIRIIVIYIIWALVIAGIYIVLREDVSYLTIIIGLILGFSTIFTCRLFIGSDFFTQFNIKILPLIWYLINLVFIIIYAGIKSLMLGLSKNTSSVILTYNSRLNNDMLITLLANSITLTPGTITIDKNDSSLRVMRLCKKDCITGVDDIAHLEKMILKIEGIKN